MLKMCQLMWRTRRVYEWHTYWQQQFRWWWQFVSCHDKGVDSYMSTIYDVWSMNNDTLQFGREKKNIEKMCAKAWRLNWSDVVTECWEKWWMTLSLNGLMMSLDIYLTFNLMEWMFLSVFDSMLLLFVILVLIIIIFI